MPVGAGAYSSLVTNIPHAEEQRRNQCNHHDDDATLHVHCVADMRAALGDGLGCESEGVERFVSASQPAPLALGFYFLKPVF